MRDLFGNEVIDAIHEETQIYYSEMQEEHERWLDSLPLEEKLGYLKRQPEEVAKRLKKLRKEKKMTQEAVALALGVTKQTISSYETGKLKPSSKALDILAKLFDVEVSFILGTPPAQESAVMNDILGKIQLAHSLNHETYLRDAELYSEQRKRENLSESDFDMIDDDFDFDEYESVILNEKDWLADHINDILTDELEFLTTEQLYEIKNDILMKIILTLSKDI